MIPNSDVMAIISPALEVSRISLRTQAATWSGLCVCVCEVCGVYGSIIYTVCMVCMCMGVHMCVCV